MEQPTAQMDSDWEPREHPANKALLTREDLDRHFGYDLNEAAHRLGVCKTTLKRACRCKHKPPLRPLAHHLKHVTPVGLISACHRSSAAKEGSGCRTGPVQIPYIASAAACKTSPKGNVIGKQVIIANQITGRSETLSRPCARRYGIARWPRRDLLKAARRQQREAAASSDNLQGMGNSGAISIPLQSTGSTGPSLQVMPLILSPTKRENSGASPGIANLGDDLDIDQASAWAFLKLSASLGGFVL